MPTITSLLGKIATYIINPLIILGFTVATAFLFYGIARMILKAGDSGDLKENRSAVIWGVAGLLIMFSVYGILHLVLNSFGITCGLYFCK